MKIERGERRRRQKGLCSNQKFQAKNKKGYLSPLIRLGMPFLSTKAEFNSLVM